MSLKFFSVSAILSKDGVRGGASVVRKGISSRLKIVMCSDNVTGQELEFDYIGREKILKV